jgi:hypothetical protein
MEIMNVERRLIELKVQYTRCRYFRARSELSKLKAIDEEDYETAATERDNLLEFDRKLSDIIQKKNELIKRKK